LNERLTKETRLRSPLEQCKNCKKWGVTRKSGRRGGEGESTNSGEEWGSHLDRLDWERSKARSKGYKMESLPQKKGKTHEREDAKRKEERHSGVHLRILITPLGGGRENNNNGGGK